MSEHAYLLNSGLIGFIVSTKSPSTANQSLRGETAANTAECAAVGTASINSPHRWMSSATELGEWVKQARIALRDGKEIDLHGSLPRGLILFRADNTVQHHERYMLSKQDRKGIDSLVTSCSELLILASANGTVRALRAFFNRSIPIWEGHTRRAMTRLYFRCAENREIRRLLRPPL